MAKRIILGGILGLFLSVIGWVLTIVITSILAFIQEVKISLFGAFTVWAEDTNGIRGLAFEPNFTAMLAVTGIVVVACAAAAVYLIPKRAVGTAS